MKIFVTGATGFIGRAFCREALQRGHQILALVRNPAPQLPPGVEIASGSLIDTPWSQVEAFSPDAALHLAWIAEPGVYLNSPENSVLLEQSKVWFQRLFEMGVAYVAGAGTCIEYAPSLQALREGVSPLAPQFPYSKAEVELFEWIKVHSPNDWAWFRIFFPYGTGEHDKRFTSFVVAQLRQNKTVIMNTPESVRDYVEMRDDASGLVAALEYKITGPVNVGSGTGITVATVAREIARLLKADSGLLSASQEVATDRNPVIVANTERLRSIGWHPQISLTAGLQSLITSIEKPA